MEGRVLAMSDPAQICPSGIRRFLSKLFEMRETSLSVSKSLGLLSPSGGSILAGGQLHSNLDGVRRKGVLNTEYSILRKEDRCREMLSLSKGIVSG